MRTLRFSVCLAVMLGVVALAAPARATGYWNTPSTFCQCMGCGWGAGYHAPLVLGPIAWEGWCDPKEVRLPHAPAPAYAGYRNGACGCDCAQPSRLESVVVPPAVAAPAQKAAPVSAIFAAPSEW